MVVLRSLLFTTALFIACWVTLPSPAAAGKNHGHHGGGIETLLTAGVLASVLQRGHGGGGGGHHHHGGGGHHHGGGGRSNSIPIGGHHQEYRHGAPSMQYPMPDGRSAMGYGPQQPMMPYGQSMPYGMPMMPYGQPMSYGQPMPYGQPMMPQMQQAPSENEPYGYYNYQPSDKLEVVRV